jgi:SAM-dependent methyltransferase
MMGRIRTLGRLARAGDLRGRLTLFRDGTAAIRVAMMGAALESGVVDALAERPATGESLAERLGGSDQSLLLPYLRLLEAAGVVRRRRGLWGLTSRGRRALADDLVRAGYEGYAGYHTGLYRGLTAQLAGGPSRRDVEEKGELIAKLSEGFDPFVDELLAGLVQERLPLRVLDLGCGAGQRLIGMMRAGPPVEGVGVEVDPAAAALAEAAIDRAGLDQRASIVRTDIAELVSRGPDGIGGPADLALLANVIYYMPVSDRVELLAGCARLLRRGGALVVVTTAAEPTFFSRHFDLLLRAQGSGMELPDLGELDAQLRAAGLTPQRPRRLTPGQSLVAVVAERPGPV